MSPYRSPADMPKSPEDIPKDRNVVVGPSRQEVVSAELFAFATVVGFQAIAFLLIGLALQ
jgi:hypothetical protein